MIGPIKPARALLIALFAAIVVAAGAYFLRSAQASEHVTTVNGTTVTQPNAGTRGEQNEKAGQPHRDDDGGD
jgi:hypothetical protein